jgi:hypothetical protein
VREFPHIRAARPFAAFERGVMYWNGKPCELKRGGDGRHRGAGASIAASDDREYERQKDVLQEATEVTENSKPFSVASVTSC